MGSVTSNPKVNIQLLPSAVVDAYADRRDLIVGQTGTGGTAVDGALNTNIETLTTAEVKTLFGSTSFLTRQILTWMAANDGASPLDVVSVAVATGTPSAATGVIAFTGTSATSDGEYEISFVDDSLYKVTVPVTTGATPTVIGAALAAAVNALDDPVFTVAAVTGTVTATATDVGTVGNYYGLKVNGNVPGITVTLTDWATGATDPTVTGILDAIEGIRYTGCLWPEHWNASLSVVKAEFENRFNPDNAVMDGTVFHGFSDTYANILTELSDQNSKCIVYMGSNVVDLATHKGPAILRPADWVCAEFAGIRARRLTLGASIADYIISTSGGSDAFGGPSLASLPYFNTPLSAVPVTAATNLFTATEQGNLEDAGYSVYGVNRSQNAMITGPIVTNWTTDAAGNPNVSFHYLNYVDTGSTCREVFYNTLKSTFAQTRLTEGDLIPGRSMANAESIKAELLRIYKTLSGLALTQAGRAAESYFAQNTVVTVSLADRKATVTGLLPIVTQLGTINYSLQLSFTITGTGTQITV